MSTYKTKDFGPFETEKKAERKMYSLKDSVDKNGWPTWDDCYVIEKDGKFFVKVEKL